MTYKEVYNTYMKPLKKRAALDNFVFYDRLHSPIPYGPYQKWQDGFRDKGTPWQYFQSIVSGLHAKDLTRPFRNAVQQRGFGGYTNPWSSYRRPYNTPVTSAPSQGGFIDASKGVISTAPVSGPSFAQQLKQYQQKPAPADAPIAPNVTQQQALNNYNKAHSALPAPQLTAPDIVSPAPAPVQKIPAPAPAQTTTTPKATAPTPAPAPSAPKAAAPAPAAPVQKEVAPAPSTTPAIGSWAAQLNEQDRKVIEDRNDKRERQEYNKKMDEEQARTSRQLDKILNSKGPDPWDPRFKSLNQRRIDRLRAQIAQGDKRYASAFKPKVQPQPTVPAKPVETVDQTTQRAFGVTQADKVSQAQLEQAAQDAPQYRKGVQVVNGYAVQDPRNSGKQGYGKTVYTDKNGKEHVQYTKNEPKPLTDQEQQFWADYNKKQQEKKLADQQRMNNYMQNRQRTFAQGSRPRPIRGSRRVYG